jgi:hypothetical protein
MITSIQLKKVAKYLKGEGRSIINEIAITHSKTDNYIKEMSIIDPEKLKVPYDI